MFNEICILYTQRKLMLLVLPNNQDFYLYLKFYFTHYITIIPLD